MERIAYWDSRNPWEKNWIHSPGALGAFRYQSSFIRNRRQRRTRHPLPANLYFPNILVAILYEHDGGGAGEGDWGCAGVEKLKQKLEV